METEMKIILGVIMALLFVLIAITIVAYVSTAMATVHYYQSYGFAEPEPTQINPWVELNSTTGQEQWEPLINFTNTQNHFYSRSQETPPTLNLDLYEPPFQVR